jgi:RNA:NAD 2'-phosphotransferase (TPT1/KptA family)
MPYSDKRSKMNVIERSRNLSVNAWFRQPCVKIPEQAIAMDSLQLSKFLSFVLRHRPDSIGISLDSQGWVLVDELLVKSRAAGTHFTREELWHIVSTSDKKRFSLSPDAHMIRAAQGHSVTVDLGRTPREPPGNPLPRNCDSIRRVDLSRRVEAEISPASSLVAGRGYRATGWRATRQANYTPGGCA